MNALQHITRNASPGRLVPLLVLLALAAALATLPAAGSVHAQGQTTVWSATLTVEGGIISSCDSTVMAMDSCSDTDVLTDNDFTVLDVGTFTVDTILQHFSGKLILSFNGVTSASAKASLRELTLKVDGESFAFSDAEVADVTGSGSEQIVWSYSTVWNDRQKVSLSLTGPVPPGLPRNLKAEAGHQKVTLTWDAVSDTEVTHYEIRQGTSFSAMTKAAWSKIAGSSKGTTTHTVTGLSNGTTYYFSIRAVGGEGLASIAVSATPAPEVTAVAVTSNPKSGDTYGGGETIKVTVTFSEAVTVTVDESDTVSGSPFLRLRVGDSNQSAHYAGGSGSTAIVFEHTVEPLDRDTDGVSIRESLIIMPSPAVTIRNAGGVDASPNHPALPDQGSHKVDGSKDNVAPTITELAMWSENWVCTGSGENEVCDYAPYTTGHVIAVQVIFSEVIVVTGTPTLDVTIGTNTRAFSYASKGYAEPGFAVFEYTVATDSDSDGISVSANSLKVPAGASIKDQSGNDAVVTHTALPAQADHKVTMGGL